MHLFAVLTLASVTLACAQSSSDEFKVYTEHPRLVLKAQRLRLVRRERERDSMRWRQFDLLISGNAQLPEPAFARALHYRVTGTESSAKTAIAAALRPEAKAREIALAYDWCQPVLDDASRTALQARLSEALTTRVNDVASARDAAFAATVLGDAPTLSRIVEGWWRGQMAPALVKGTRALSHADLYPLMELFHAIRDNLQIDMREDIPPVFRDMAAWRLLSYYPAPLPAAENEYRIPFYRGKGDPDLRLAALTRAGELALVAYENNAEEMQFLQGWLLQDRFMLRSAFGAPYEFLWANPYQPGLPYEKMPLLFRDDRTGLLLVRSNWEEDATWAGISAGWAEIFRQGRPQPLVIKQPLRIGDVMIAAGDRLRIAPDSPPTWFLTGLKPETLYNIEIDDEDMTEDRADRSGILRLEFTRSDNQTVMVQPHSRMK